MGIFGALMSIVKEVAKEPESSKHSSKSYRGSAISSGRMNQTDTIKGKNCKVPKAAGEYRHINKVTGIIEYIGQTDNLRKRQQEHARNGKLNLETQKVAYKVAKPTATKEDLLSTEKNHIAKYKPSGNKTVGGNGRRSK